MKGKLLFVAGVAIGYVLGARAGRKRYEQIKSAAESVWNAPTVQQGVDQVKGFALARVGDVSDTILDGAKKVVASVTKSQGGKPSATTEAAQPAAPQKRADRGSKASAKGSTRTKKPASTDIED
ncbi:YtxH domain-containing protein [Luethyella okanaganae]|uniref:YtxH domain-containing protein n=1 Tax=Luethyella okanaganae TaxID=69372 RepID=A0ABW1VE87_9MICO